MLLKKPAMVFSVIATTLFVIYLFSQLDLSIADDPKKEQENLIMQGQARVSGLIGKEKIALSKMETEFDNFKAHKNAKKLQEAQSSSIAVIESCHTAITELSNQAIFGPEFQKTMKTLSALLKERFQIVKKGHAVVVAHFEAESKGSVTDKSREKLAESMAEFEIKRFQVDGKIKAQLLIQ